jgi:hypothetical protein
MSEGCNVSIFRIKQCLMKFCLTLKTEGLHSFRRLKTIYQLMRFNISKHLSCSNFNLLPNQCCLCRNTTINHTIFCQLWISYPSVDLHTNFSTSHDYCKSQTCYVSVSCFRVMKNVSLTAAILQYKSHSLKSEWPDNILSHKEASLSSRTITM